MRAVLDACVLYPPVLREILLGLADLYTPLWSERILEEWVRATEKLGQMSETRVEAALMAARYPRAMLRAAPHLETRLILPDANDLQRVLDHFMRQVEGVRRFVDHGEDAGLPHLDHLPEKVPQHHSDLILIGRVGRH